MHRNTTPNDLGKSEPPSTSAYLHNSPLPGAVGITQCEKPRLRNRLDFGNHDKYPGNLK